MSEVVYAGSLKSKRKNELQEIARAMGLSVDVSVKISDLVAQIQHEMETRREELILHPQFKRLFRPARASASQKNDTKVSSSTLNSGSDTHSHSDSELHSDDSTVQIEASSGSRAKNTTGGGRSDGTEENDEELINSKPATNQADASSDDSSDEDQDEEKTQQTNAESRPSVLAESLAYALTSPFKALPASSPQQKKTPAKASSSSSPNAGSPRGPSSARKTPSSNKQAKQSGATISTLGSPIKSAVQTTIQSLTPAPDSPIQRAVSSVLGSPTVSKLSNAIPQAAAQIASVAAGTPSKLRQQILPVTESPAAAAAAEAASAVVDSAGQTLGQVEDVLIDAGKVVVEKVGAVDGQAVEGFLNEAVRESDLVLSKMNRALKETHSVLSTPSSQTISLLVLEAAYLLSNVLTFKTTTFTLPPKSLTSSSILNPSTPWVSLALKVVDWETIKQSKIDVFGPLAVWISGLVLLPLFLAGLMASSSSSSSVNSSSASSSSEEQASSDVPEVAHNTRHQTKRRSILPHPSQTVDSSLSSDVLSTKSTSNPLIFTILRFGIFLIAQTQLEEFGTDGLLLGQLKKTGLVSTERIGLGIVLSGVGILLGFAQRKF